MIVNYNKYNIILYFLTGTTVTFAFKRWIYGILILLLFIVILLQTLLINSNIPVLLKYKNVGNIIVHGFILVIIITSLYVLKESTSITSRKIQSIVYLIISILFEIYKSFYPTTVTSGMSSVIFMLFIVNIAIMPENQLILKKKYTELNYTINNNYLYQSKSANML